MKIAPTPASVPAPVLDPVANSTATIMALGGGAIILLLGGYILWEWGAHLLRRVRDEQCKPSHAKLLFGVPALGFALLLPVALGYAMSYQLFGMNPDMETQVNLVTTALFASIVGELIALMIFFHLLNKIPSVPVRAE